MKGLISEAGFEYIETNPEADEVIVLLHGLMGALSNFECLLEDFGKEYDVVIPHLPIFSMPLTNVGLKGLLEYVTDFIEYKKFDSLHVLGNSLGGHLCQLYTLQNMSSVNSMTLTGSSGLFESALGTSFPKRGSYDYIKAKAEDVFYDKSLATKELVDSVFRDVNDRNRALRIVKTAKSAIRHNLGNKLSEITVPSLLIWGKEDSVTPAFVGEEFHKLLPNSELHIIPECGHAPMMELPKKFNQIYREFLSKL